MCAHNIDTGDATPIKERARRIPPKWEQEIERQLDEMITNGVCQPSHQWRSQDLISPGQGRGYD